MQCTPRHAVHLAEVLQMALAGGSDGEATTRAARVAVEH
jgi:hypothetical protein